MKCKTLAIMAAAMLLLCGCGTDGGITDNREKTYRIPEYTLAGEYREGRPDIYLIVKNVDNSYFQVMFDAAGEASDAFDCNVYYSGTDDSADWKTQEILMDIAEGNGADAVILAPNDSVNLADKALELHENGIAVVCVDAIINGDGCDICYMTDNLFAGEQAARELIENLKRNGNAENDSVKIAVQTGRSLSQAISERVAGFCEYWTGNAPPTWTIITDMKSNEGDDSKAYPLAEEFFREYDDIKGVFGTNVGTTRGFAEYLSANGRTDVAIVGFDYSDEIASLINDSSCNASVILQRQYDMVYRGIGSAMEIKNGTFSSEVKFIDTGVLIVNSANINDPDVQEVIGRN